MKHIKGINEVNDEKFRQMMNHFPEDIYQFYYDKCDPIIDELSKRSNWEDRSRYDELSSLKVVCRGIIMGRDQNECWKGWSESFKNNCIHFLIEFHSDYPNVDQLIKDIKLI